MSRTTGRLSSISNSIAPRARTILFRLVDQGLWSVSFFIFNISASIILSVGEYAALAVCTAVAFVVVAVVRSGSINARLVAGARAGISPEDTLSPSVISKWSAFAVVFSAVVCFCWLAVGESPTHTVLLIAVSTAIVAADAPHQLLIFASRYVAAVLLSTVYVVLALIAMGLLTRIGTSTLLLMWLSSSVAIGAIGWLAVLRRSSGRPVPPLVDARRYSWRLSAEALYVGASSQMTIFILYFLNDSDAAAGFRLGYALIFAPAFMIVQGISPLFLKSLARDVNRLLVVRKALFWVCGVFCLIVLCGASGWCAAVLFPGYSALQLALSYLIPVGLSVLSGQVLEGIMSASRFFFRPDFLHRLRLLVVIAELSFQFLAIIVSGVPGLIFSVVIISVTKIILGFSLLGYVRWNRGLSV